MTLRVAAFLAMIALALAACSGAPAATPAGTPAVTLGISATNNVFDRTEMTAVADAPFAIRFQNNDSVPHNVSIRGGSTAMVGEIFTGPAERTSFFAGVAQGTYAFVCDVHPEMKGTLISN